MSTGFATPAIAKKPSLICAGRVSAVGDAYLGKSENYYVVKIEIEAVDAGVDKALYLLFRPEWMHAMSHTEIARFQEEQPGAYRMYQQHIAANLENSKPSHLQGLTGYVSTQSNATPFNELGSRLCALGIDAVTETPTLVSDTIRKFLLEEREGEIIGYVVSQQTEKTGEVDENGKNVYVPSKWTEVSNYWAANDSKALDRQTKKAEKSPDKYKMAFSGVVF